MINFKPFTPIPPDDDPECDGKDNNEPENFSYFFYIPDIKDHQRPKKVELFFHGKGPKMTKMIFFANAFEDKKEILKIKNEVRVIMFVKTKMLWF